MIRIFGALATTLALATSAVSAVSAEPLPSHEPLPVVDLAWMSGTWAQVRETGMIQEVWTRPSFGTMAGASLTAGVNRKAGFEFMTITTINSRPVFTAYLQGQPPTVFALKPGEPGVAVFENLEHDFPQRVIYRRCGEDLCARIEGLVKGELKGMDWRYSRVSAD